MAECADRKVSGGAGGGTRMNIVDYVLAAALLLFLPGEALFHSLSPTPRPPRPLAARMIRTIRMIGVLLLVLAILWWWEGRALALLGFDLPLTTGGLIGLGIAAVLLALLALPALMARSGNPLPDRPGRSDVLPKIPAETQIYVAFAFAAGIGWEVLYRGYLLWALTPFVGLWGGVVIAAIAYGLAHASRKLGAILGAVISSFAFTIGYALTGSLWWLIVIHVALPLMGLLVGRAGQKERQPGR